MKWGIFGYKHIREDTFLKTISSEADSLLIKAEEYRSAMDALPQEDARRDVYEKMILDLLKRSYRLAVSITTFLDT